MGISRRSFRSWVLAVALVCYMIISVLRLEAYASPVSQVTPVDPPLAEVTTPENIVDESLLLPPIAEPSGKQIVLNGDPVKLDDLGPIIINAGMNQDLILISFNHCRLCRWNYTKNLQLGPTYETRAGVDVENNQETKFGAHNGIKHSARI
jgi:hypothetical protein